MFDESFDYNYYLEENPDVKIKFGNDKQKLWNHWRIYGIHENRKHKFNISESISSTTLLSPTTILHKHNITIEHILPNINNLTALGIGDLLMSFILMRQNKIQKPVYINLIHFMSNKTYPNPINAFEFRIDLLDLITNNNINTYYKFIYDNNNYVNQHTSQRIELNNFSINLNFNKNKLSKNLIDKEYIVFHTKFRMSHNYNYDDIKQKLKTFFSSYKISSQYSIVILGEKWFPKTEEGIYQGITTIYDELLYLKNNNNVIDLSIDEIYNDLNIDNYMNDINIIHYAKYNICIGYGGQFCNCLFYNDNIIQFKGNMSFNDSYINTPILKQYDNINDFFDKLKSLSSGDLLPLESSISTIKKCFLLTHLGLGDLICSIGMIRYLRTQYDNVIFVCKNKYIKKLNSIFSDDPYINIYEVNDDSDISPAFGCNINKFDKIMKDNKISNVYLCGLHNPKCNHNFNNIPFSFYNEINIDKNIFWTMFKTANYSEKSIELYNKINTEYIIIHNLSSTGTCFNIESVEKHFKKSRNDIIFIVLMNNIYPKEHKYYSLAQLFCNPMIFQYYDDTFINAKAIYMSDSSFFCYAIHLNIKTNDCFVIQRSNNDMTEICSKTKFKKLYL